MNRKNKTRIKRIKTEARIVTKNIYHVKWLLHWRPKMQKMFFPIIGIIILIGILNYERNERGTMTFTNAAAAPEESVESVEVKTIASDSPEVSGVAVSIEEKILKAFNGDKVALAVAKSESGLDPNAKGYNCRYNGVSKSCKPEDREKAWSVDCGLWQINSLTKECPEHLMDVEVNIAIAKEMQSKRGWQPWVGWWSGQYLNHMN